MITFDCGNCGRKISVKDEYAGKRGKCPQCKAVVEVPALAPEPEADGLPDFDAIAALAQREADQPAEDSQPAEAPRPLKASVKESDSSLLDRLKNLKESSKEWSDGKWITVLLAGVVVLAIIIGVPTALTLTIGADKTFLLLFGTPFAIIVLLVWYKSRPSPEERAATDAKKRSSVGGVLGKVALVIVLVPLLVLVFLKLQGRGGGDGRNCTDDSWVHQESRGPDRTSDAAATATQADEPPKERAAETKATAQKQADDAVRRASDRQLMVGVQSKFEVYYSSVYPRILRDLAALEGVGKGKPDQNGREWLAAFLDAYRVVIQDERDRVAQMPVITREEQTALGDTYQELNACDAALATRLKCAENFHGLARAVLTDAVNGRWQGNENQAVSTIAEVEAKAVACRREAELQHGVSISQLNRSELTGWKARIAEHGLGVDDVEVAAAATEAMRTLQEQARREMANTGQQNGAPQGGQIEQSYRDPIAIRAQWIALGSAQVNADLLSRQADAVSATIGRGGSVSHEADAVMRSNELREQSKAYLRRALDINEFLLAASQRNETLVLRVRDAILADESIDERVRERIRR